jgi:protein O-GlcNAc transferase
VSEQVFDAWCEILRRLPSAVLWLLEYNDRVRQALMAAASARGIDPKRLLFAPKIPTELNLDRMTCADVFLDTWPCNAHTTASEALWAELPVVSLIGQTFAGRVAASILNAVGLAELVVHSPDAYVEDVISLANDPGRRARLKQHLAQQRGQSPLFDGTRFARDIEALYARMWARHESGLAPAALAAE